jgi:hypothetical protein
VFFLFHLRSAFVAIVSLPLGILAAFTVMNWQGVDANIMSLGGIAIAIGAMVDAAVVMIENAHKHLETWHHENPDRKPTAVEQSRLIGMAAAEVGPPLFFSLLIITLSFLPVFTLEAQEGKLFGSVSDPDPRADVLLRPWTDTAGTQQSHQPCPHPRVPAAARRRAAASDAYVDRFLAIDAGRQRAAHATGQRIHAAAGGG